MEYVTRSEWGAAPARYELPKIGQVAGLAVHWEGPRMGAFPHGDCAGKVRGIQRFHIQTRGWADIAYSFLVCPHGKVFEGRGWGKRSAANGTTEANAAYYAACYLGGEGDPLTDAGKRAFVDLAVKCKRRHPRTVLRPHSAFRPTACPGPDLRAWVAGFRWPAVQPEPEPTVQPASTPTPQELPDVFIAYYPNGQAYLMYSNGTKRLIAGEDIGALKAILPVALAPKLLDHTPSATPS